MFSSLDFNSGLWQIRMAEQNQRKCFYVIMDGQFEFARVSFGLDGATATLQRDRLYLIASEMERSCLLH